jgi:uncharacterized protein YhbP (UPF0306 family)
VTDSRSGEALAFIDERFIGTLASVGDGSPAAATIFYVRGAHTVLYFKSRTASTHSRNLLGSDHAAMTIYDHGATYARKHGIQLRGHVRRVVALDEMANVVELYSAAFEGSGSKLPSLEVLVSDTVASTFYAFDMADYKITLETPEENATMLEFDAFHEAG